MRPSWRAGGLVEFSEVNPGAIHLKANATIPT